MSKVDDAAKLALASVRQTADDFVGYMQRLERDYRHVEGLSGLCAVLTSAAHQHAISCRDLETLMSALLDCTAELAMRQSQREPRASGPCGQFMLDELALPLPLCAVCGHREAAHDRLPSPDRTADTQRAPDVPDFSSLADSPRAAETLASLADPKASES